MAVDNTTILIVEDEPAIVELVSFTVKEAGWHCAAVHSASDAWDFIQRRIQFIQHHFQQPLPEMRGCRHHVFKGFAPETTHHQIRGGGHVISCLLPPRPPEEIGRKQKADHLAPTILHRLRQGRNSGDDGSDEIHAVA